ncbi:MAG: cytochrome C [Betaproteobacteria bacterium]|nr:cytochrome C [Betaproteobacteria bacterium]
MRISRILVWAVAGVLFWGASGIGEHDARAADADSDKPAAAAAPTIDSAICLGCHGNEGFAVPDAIGKVQQLHVSPGKFGGSVHGNRQCVECHKDINEIPHQKGKRHQVGCVTCHEDLWAKAQKENKTKEFARLGVVVQQIESYMKSIHARPNREDQSRTNATCYNCHDAHYVYPKGSAARTQWRLNLPNVCGECHTKQRNAYVKSVHGDEVIWKRNADAAVCSDCHTTHDVESPKLDSSRLVITQNCGTCHEKSLKSYISTYHGQVNRLGYAHTAKCFDCHGSHTIQRAADPQSAVHPAHRLQTCQTCHANATKGFISFEPHGTTNDFIRFPQIWIASWFMIGLLAGTFAFFWTHSVLWFYREYKERQERKSRPHVRTEALLHDGGKYYRRFSWQWRVAHLVFALCLMTLTLTGMSLLFSTSSWAPVVMKALGGPEIAGLIHRTAAVVFAAIFFGHLVYVARYLARNLKTFNWFGPFSMVPNLQDIKDIFSMFKWFLGQGPRPVFERWTYWEKFDYWAPFWGVTIIGASGVMLWFPEFTASYLPGWVFNVATILHGEEAVLAVGFLFTVHFFNNHFRPDKFPLDILMFTGAMPLEEFAKEHSLEYKRLVATGELEKHLVHAPSEPMTLGSKILGFTLIAIGLTLLTLVITGFVGQLSGG